MEKLSRDAIPGLIIIDAGYVTKLSLPDEEIEELAEQKEAWYPTTRDWPDLIICNAGTVTRIDGKLIRT